MIWGNLLWDSWAGHVLTLPDIDDVPSDSPATIPPSVEMLAFFNRSQDLNPLKLFIRLPLSGRQHLFRFKLEQPANFIFHAA